MFLAGKLVIPALWGRNPGGSIGDRRIFVYLKTKLVLKLVTITSNRYLPN